MQVAGQEGLVIRKPLHAHFEDLASKLIDEALRQCGDESPPLCILQALILTTFHRLIQGVRGVAWRSLGACVRLAYELDLHLIDSPIVNRNLWTDMDVRQWCADEERRRAWWAIWEMDVFASTVRRRPTAIDWSQNETSLPVNDELWFRGQMQKSCLLEQSPINRWKALHRSGNDSPKAWFIVVNSLMREAQMISSPRALPKPGDSCQIAIQTAGASHNFDTSFKEKAERLGTLANALRCFSLSLPEPLRYRGQHLSFDAAVGAGPTPWRHLHASIYSIHTMTQLAKLMIYHCHVFGGLGVAPRHFDTAISNVSSPELSAVHYSSNPDGNHESTGTDRIAMAQYFEAADNILEIVSMSSDNHVRHVSPFSASLIWLAAAVHLIRKAFNSAGISENFANSKFDVISLCYQQYVSFWNISMTMQQNLDSLELRLEQFRTAKGRQGLAGEYEQDKSRSGNMPNGNFSHASMASSAASRPAAVNNRSRIHPFSGPISPPQHQINLQRLFQPQHSAEIFESSVSSLAQSSSFRASDVLDTHNAATLPPSTMTPPASGIRGAETELVDALSLELDLGGIDAGLLGEFLMSSSYIN